MNDDWKPFDFKVYTLTLSALADYLENSIVSCKMFAAQNYMKS